jgi:nucleoside-diphosphate-sugar epimerase
VAPGHVTDEDQVIPPARDGALRVLRAARAAGIERVVLTSAFHAVGFGHPHSDHVFTEEDWSVLDGPAWTPTDAARSSPSRPPGTSSSPRAGDPG